MFRNVLRASGSVTLASGALQIGLLLLLLLLVVSLGFLPPLVPEEPLEFVARVFFVGWISFLPANSVRALRKQALIPTSGLASSILHQPPEG